MLRRLSIGLLASAVAIAPLPLKAQDGSAEDLGDVMSISLKDVVKPSFGFQGALQGAGTTPSKAGKQCRKQVAGSVASLHGDSAQSLELVTTPPMAFCQKKTCRKDRPGDGVPKHSSTRRYIQCSGTCRAHF